jgi:1-acyl-sn-glycerol-3-phosphate acyltransferase
MVGNHQSFFDPVLVGYGLGREVDYMARDSLFKNPIFGKLIASFNAFPVKRGEADISAIKETLRRLKENRAVLLFPEGTRSPDGRIRPFKPGLELIARKAKATIVPVVIDGAYDAWPRTSPIPKPFRTIRVIFGKPIAPDDIGKFTPDEFVTFLHQQMIQMQSQIRTMGKKQPYDYQKSFAEVKTDEEAEKK